MARRNLLHVKDVEQFKDWVRLHTEYEYKEPTVAERRNYILFKVCIHRKWHCLFKRRDMPEHVTVPQPLVRHVRKFLAWKKAQREAYDATT